MALKQVSNGNSDGTQVGQNKDDKIGFYGKAPVAQAVLASSATAADIVAELTRLGLVRAS